MDIYKELFFKGKPSELKKFSIEINKFVSGNWIKVNPQNGTDEFLSFEYTGEDVEKAELSIFIGNLEEKNEIMVTNIIPLKKGQLTIAEYNKVLERFYIDVIEPFKLENKYINISELTSDKFDPLTMITEIALKKLKLFTRAANKSTGTSHPLDRKRWYDFICQTVEDNQVFDYQTLYRFLKDEEYWGNTDDEYAWSEEWASKLAEDYVSAIDILTYYKNQYIEE